MDKKKWSLKIGVLFGALVLFALYFFFNHLRKVGFCIKPYHSWSCQHLFESLALGMFVLSISFLFFTLITLLMKDVVFKKWFSFARLYMPSLFSIYLVFLWLNDGSLWGNSMGGQIQLAPLVLLIAIYFIASTKIIIKEWFLIYRNKDIKSWVLYSVLYGLVILACVIVSFF